MQLAIFAAATRPTVGSYDNMRDMLMIASAVRTAKMVVEPLHRSTAVIYSLAALRGQPPPPTPHLLRATLVHDTQYTVPNGHLVSG